MNNQITHPTLGKLQYDDSLGWYDTEVLVDNRTVVIHLSAETKKEATQCTNAASQLLPSLSLFLSNAKQFAANELLELKNDTWSEEDGSRVSSQEFSERLEIESVTFYFDNTVEIIFKDGGLFFGHVVIISGNCNGEFSEATIAG